MADGGFSTIYLGTVLMEPNRWKAGRTPSFRVSEWMPRAKAAGFDGLELWENHALRVEAQERDRIRTGGMPVAIVNSYAETDDSPGAQTDRERAAALAAELGAEGLKFNVGKDPARREEYLRNVRNWAALLPPGARMLCECHGGTILETPGAAAGAFREWEDPRFQAIVHAFGSRPDDLRAWCRALGPRLTHVHAHVRDGTLGWVRLEEKADETRASLRVLSEEGFRGSCTLEFTRGTGREGETPQALFESAVRDLAFLRACVGAPPAGSAGGQGRIPASPAKE